MAVLVLSLPRSTAVQGALLYSQQEVLLSSGEGTRVTYITCANNIGILGWKPVILRLTSILM